MINIDLTVKFLILALLNVLDGLFTYWGVVHIGAGPEIEANPMIRYLMYEIGPTNAILWAKIVSIVCCFLIVRFFRLTDSPWAYRGYVMLIVVYGLVVGHWGYNYIHYYLG